MSEAAVFWRVYTSVPTGGIDLLAEAGGLPVQGILCIGAGNLAATHSTPIEGDTSETIPAVAGQYFPVRANAILDTTTALPFLVLWGYGSGSVITPGISGGGGGGGGDASATNQLIEISKLTSIDDNLPQIGPQAKADSMSVTFATDEGPVPVSGTLDIDNFPADPATATNQSAANDILTSIDGKTYPPATRHVHITSLPPEGIDLRTMIPGKKAVAIEGYAISSYGNLRYVLYDDSDADPQFITKNFGSNYVLQGQVFGFIRGDSDPSCLPFRVYFA